MKNELYMCFNCKNIDVRSKPFEELQFLQHFFPSPFSSKANRRIRCDRRTRWVADSGFRRDTSAHTELRSSTTQTICRHGKLQSECANVQRDFAASLPNVMKGMFWLGYSRVWQSIPCHPGAQWHVLAPTHSPPFRHFCRQLAERETVNAER